MKPVEDLEIYTAFEAAIFQSSRAIDNILEAVCITNPLLKDNPIVYANEAFSQLTGYSQQEVLGKNCRILQGPRTSKQSVQRVRNALAHRESIAIQMENYRKDGSVFWNHLTISPITNHRGTVVNFVGIQRDITRYKELEVENANQKKLIATLKKANTLLQSRMLS